MFNHLAVSIVPFYKYLNGRITFDIYLFSQKLAYWPSMSILSFNNDTDYTCSEDSLKKCRNNLFSLNIIYLGMRKKKVKYSKICIFVVS